MYNIIILRSRSQSQCKRFFKDGEDTRSKPADPTKYFRYESKAVDGIAEFASLLTDLEQDRSRFIVRGQLAEDVDKDKPMRRRLWLKDRSEPNELPFLDEPAPWVMIDIDKLALPEGMSVSEDTSASLEHATSDCYRPCRECMPLMRHLSVACQGRCALLNHRTSWLSVLCATEALC